MMTAKHFTADAPVEPLAGREARPSDLPLVELLRLEGPLGVGAIAARLAVTPTAVRQRLDRLVRDGLVVRSGTPATCAAEPAVRRGRGRPAHVFSLSQKGHRIGGENYRDLAIVLWRELRGIADAGVRRGLLGRIGSALADLVRADVAGKTPAARLEGTAEWLRRRRVAAEFRDGELPVLVTHACPYPGLAESDRGICAAERMMMEHIVGSPIRLSECRLDGGDCCRFALEGPATAQSVDVAPVRPV